METREAPAPRLWIGWALVVAAVGLAIIAWRTHAPAGKVEATPAPAVAAATQPERAAPAPSSLPGPAQPPRTAIQILQAKADARAARAQSRHQYWVDGFAAQKVDPQWSARQQQAILAMTRTGDFATDPAKPRNLAVDCKSSVCRLKADFPSTAEAQDWVELVTLHSGGRFTGGATQVRQRKDGSAEVTIFVQPR